METLQTGICNTGSVTSLHPSKQTAPKLKLQLQYPCILVFLLPTTTVSYLQGKCKKTFTTTESIAETPISK